jgi:CO/xanthine dehydrogenase Mo-binding subunit
MDEVYYKKVGRKYVEVARSDVINSFPMGASLVICEPGATMKYYKVEPALAPMVAASQDAKHILSKVLMDELSLRPNKIPHTEEQISAWKKLSEAYGEQIHPLAWPSVYAAVEAAMKVLQEDAQRMLEYPVVKKAYEDFLLVYKLTKEQK